jgi:DNA-binding MarR family transcriptional regulator
VTLPRDHVDAIVTQWRRERPDLDVRPLASFGRVLRLAQLADGELGRLLTGHGLQPGWFDVLAALRRAGTPYELTPGRLLEAMIVTSGGLTKRLDRMVEAGLVSRRPDPADRRGTLVRLTRKGRTTIDRALADHVANEGTLLAPLTAAEQRTLDGLLRRLLVALESPSS